MLTNNKKLKNTKNMKNKWQHFFESSLILAIQNTVYISIISSNTCLRYKKQDQVVLTDSMYEYIQYSKG